MGTYLSESGSTRLIKALDTGTLPRIKNPKTGKLMSQNLSETMVRRAMRQPYEPGMDALLAAALQALDGRKHTPILGTDPLTRQSIYNLVGLDSANCRHCGAVIWWGATPNGKRIPLNRRGVSHFTDCPHVTTKHKTARAALERAQKTASDEAGSQGE